MKFFASLQFNFCFRNVLMVIFVIHIVFVFVILLLLCLSLEKQVIHALLYGFFLFSCFQVKFSGKLLSSPFASICAGWNPRGEHEWCFICGVLCCHLVSEHKYPHCSTVLGSGVTNVIIKFVSVQPAKMSNKTSNFYTLWDNLYSQFAMDNSACWITRTNVKFLVGRLFFQCASNRLILKGDFGWSKHFGWPSSASFFPAESQFEQLDRLDGECFRLCSLSSCLLRNETDRCITRQKNALLSNSKWCESKHMQAFIWKYIYLNII